MNRIQIRRGDTVLLAAADEALCSIDRLRGLLGRKELTHTEGLLLRRCCAIHTFGMRFSIDVIFLSMLGRVVAVREQLEPQRFAHELAASQVLEVSAGSIVRWQLRLAEQLSLERHGE